jgi:prepilin-type N-terminal cleavage/methylation domain-containing protein
MPGSPHTCRGGGRLLTFPRPAGHQKGFTVTELAVTVGIIAIMATLTIPMILTATNSLTMSRGAREIQAALNQARTLAITSRQNICFQAVAGGYAFLQGSCAGAAWIGANTTGTGLFRPADNVTMSGGGAVFTPFGTASTTAVITVSGPGGSSTTTVTVQPSGRVTIP